MVLGRWKLLVLLVAGRVAAQEQIPFPVKRSTILREGGVTYFVEGRRKIPRGCEISVQKDVYIVARGSSAVIEVEGSLQIHGVFSREVILAGVTVEPSKNCEDIQLDMVKFRKSGGLISNPQIKAKGKVFVENVIFEMGTRLDLALAGGRVDLSSVGCAEPARVAGLIEEGRRFSGLVVNIRGCFHITAPNGFAGGLQVTGARDATVRLSHMAGAQSLFRDCLKLTFDGNKVRSDRLVFEQSEPGRMKKTKLQKCDIYSSKLILKAPPGKKESVLIDKCWFRGLAREKQIRQQIISEGNGVRFKFGKIHKRPLELAGPLER